MRKNIFTNLFLANHRRNWPAQIFEWSGLLSTLCTSSSDLAVLTRIYITYHHTYTFHLEIMWEIYLYKLCDWLVRFFYEQRLQLLIAWCQLTQYADTYIYTNIYYGHLSIKTISQLQFTNQGFPYHFLKQSMILPWT